MPSPRTKGQALPPEIQKLMQQLAKDPRSKAFIQLAEEYAKVGQLEDAAAVLEEGVKVYPTFITALVALGRVYVQLDLPSKARGVLEEAIKISPDNLLAHRMLARIYASAQAWDKARQACETVLFSHPTDDEMLALRVELTLQTEPGHPSPFVTPHHTELGYQTTDDPTNSQDDPLLVAQPLSVDAPDSASGGTDPLHAEEQPVTEGHAGQSHTSDATSQPSGKVDQLHKLLEKIRERRAP